MKFVITRASPLSTIQDEGRFGYLKYGVSASGPMDKNAYFLGADLLNTNATSAVEFTQAGMDFIYYGEGKRVAFTGGDFSLFINQKEKNWRRVYKLAHDDEIIIKPNSWGNYGYIRFDGELDVKPILGSRATNTIVSLGGFGGNALKVGDEINLLSASIKNKIKSNLSSTQFDNQNNIFHIIWGVHANLFSQQIRDDLISKPFFISSQLNRMGVRLIDKNKIFEGEKILSLVSEPVVCGDIQILGDGVATVLMRDHQPSGGYPRIGTIISSDIDRFAQMRPNSKIFFKSKAVK